MLSFSYAVKVDRQALDVRKEAAAELYENGTRDNILFFFGNSSVQLMCSTNLQKKTCTDTNDCNREIYVLLIFKKYAVSKSV